MAGCLKQKVRAGDQLKIGGATITFKDSATVVVQAPREIPIERVKREVLLQNSEDSPKIPLTAE